MGPISPIRSRSHNPSPPLEPLAPLPTANGERRTVNPSPSRLQLYFADRTRDKNPFVNRLQEPMYVFASYPHQAHPMTDNPAER
jgi:hypothetical protein